MAERSLRAPSPSHSPVGGPSDDAPPVPSIPEEVPEVSVVHRRASSLDPPFRGGSPAKRGGGRGVSLDRGVVSPVNRGHTARIMSLSQVPEIDTDNTSRSINFSRPISPQTSSPARGTGSPSQGHGWFTGPVVTDQEFRGGDTPKQKAPGLTAHEVLGLQHSIHSAANQPVATKKGKMAKGAEGARLRAGSMGAKPTGSTVPTTRSPLSHSAYGKGPQPVDPHSPSAVYDPDTRTFISKQDAFRKLSEEEDVFSEDRPMSDGRIRTTPKSNRLPETISPREHRSLREQPLEWKPSASREQTPPSSMHTSAHHVHFVEKVPERASTTIPQRLPTPPPEAYITSPAKLVRQSSEDYGEVDQKSVADRHETTRTPVERPESSTSNHSAHKRTGSYPRLSIPDSAASKPVIETPAASTRAERTQSLSPPRAAHFAPVAIEFSNGDRHDPPARSVSPAKSALKSSPSVSRRDRSPNKPSYRIAPSEASDTVSEDGMKRKKRVSFDEEAVIAGSSAYADMSPSSPSGLSTSRWSALPAPDEDMDDILTPRPALPSFGSIRGQHRRPDSDGGSEKAAESLSSSMSASLASATPLETSTDLAIGGILAQNLASKQSTADKHYEAPRSHSDPLPPEVTSVEGSGYVSDSDQSDQHEPVREEHQFETPKETNTSLPELEPKTLTKSVDASKPVVLEIPAIAILPASPSPTQAFESPSQLFAMPGGWEDENVSDSIQPTASNGTIQTKDADNQPSAAGSSKNTSDDSSDDDSGSLYADAYEDLPDSDDGGFASIDAVVETSIATTAVPVPSLLPSLLPREAGPVTAVPTSGTGTERQRTEPRNEQTDELQGGTLKWSDGYRVAPDVQPQQKLSLASEPSEPTAVTHVLPAPDVIQYRPKEERTELHALSEASKPRAPSQSPSTSAKPLKSVLKKSSSPARETASPTQMKRTMRGGAQPSTTTPSEPRLRSSMRGETAPPTKIQPGLAASRYSVAPLETKPGKGGLQKRQTPTANVSQKAPRQAPAKLSSVKQPPPAPAPAYDSDSGASQSSFVRDRPRASRKGDGFSMRKSMRGSAGGAPTMRETPSMRPTSMRPTSPLTGSSPPSLRKSMRPISPTPAPGLASSRFSIRSLSPGGRSAGKRASYLDSPPMLPTQPKSKKRTSKLGFGKSPKPSGPSTGSAKSAFKSRFADSSDSDDDRPRRFQSRFVDSDSEEEEFELPKGLTPVRGIPRRQGEEDGDSTDLEDEASDTEKDTKKSEAGITNDSTSTSKHASFVPTALMDSKHAPQTPTFESVKPKTKRGFLGLGKKKTTPTKTEELGSNQPQTDLTIPAPPQPKNRPLTPIGEDEASPSPARAPKLQRRRTPQWGRSTSDTWPLPQNQSTTPDNARPSTSDGPSRSSMRPSLMKRFSSTSQGSTSVTITGPGAKEGGMDANGVVGKGGKKKKFPKMRRWFGLNG